MNDDELLGRIHSLVDEEHELRSRHHAEPLDDGEKSRLDDLEVALDQCWDLLRQRRAKREAGLNPDDAQVRSEGTVEGYRQ